MRIAVIGSDINGKSASWYRCLVPRNYLRTKGVDIVRVFPPYSPLALLGVDAIYAHKPSEAEYFPLIKICKDLGIYVWFDYDDDLFNVPEDHPAYNHYVQKDLLLGIMSAADMITVSTPTLADVVKAVTQEQIPVRVIRNYIPYHSMGVSEPTQRIGWRGGESHRLELEYNAHLLTEARGELHLWGIATTKITRPYKYHGRLLSTYEYMDSIREVRPSTFYCFWNDTVFNQSKSDVILLECALVGAALKYYGPVHPELGHPGVKLRGSAWLLYRKTLSQDGWVGAVEYLRDV